MSEQFFRYEVRMGKNFKGLLSVLPTELPWLDVPQLPEGKYKFYFTERGRDYFESHRGAIEPFLWGREIRVVSPKKVTVFFRDQLQVAERRVL